ncbi:RnfABCDGE type electron transport complex subunit D [Aquitalea sp.]|jgi:electron transport complex protein RnfD|uniref:RnfABCDGE type electron transport complex subunit D n=1 Tax=Aquitalea sp. TaxID=1872623 RepID=UPI00258B1286|nr:RnfABCDGE type electron transport complex subunit D [Aquitalea sp.]
MISTTIRLAPTLACRQRQTLLALLPAVLVWLAQQGEPALFSLLLALSCSLLGEIACLYLRKQTISQAWQQASSLLSGVLLSLLFPAASSPVVLIAACMAAVLLRQLSNGPFHPVTVSLLLLAPWLPTALPVTNLPLSLALLMGCLWLAWRHLLAWQAPTGVVLVLLLSLPQGTGWMLLQPALWLLAGWVMTDGNSTPITPRGRLLHGVAAGLLCGGLSLQDSWMNIGSVLAASLLLLSACAPLLDRLLLSPPSRT